MKTWIMASALVLAGVPAAALAADRTIHETAPQFAQAQPSQGRPAQSRSEARVSAEDLTFARAAAADGLAEVAVSQLALERAQSPAVRDFAQQMVTDHTRANQQLAQLAQAENIPLPSSPDEEHQELMQKLRQLSGAQFDRAYMEGQVTDHQNDIKLYRDQINNGSNPQLKSYAQQTLPILQQHLQRAQQVVASAQ